MSRRPYASFRREARWHGAAEPTPSPSSAARDADDGGDHLSGVHGFASARAAAVRRCRREPSPTRRAAATPLSPDRYKLDAHDRGDTLEKAEARERHVGPATPEWRGRAGPRRALTPVASPTCAEESSRTRPKPRPTHGSKATSGAGGARHTSRRGAARGLGAGSRTLRVIGSRGHRCNERRFVEFHHLSLRSRREASVDQSSCDAGHTTIRGRLYFGKRRRDGWERLRDASVVRDAESRAMKESCAMPRRCGRPISRVRNSFRNEFARGQGRRPALRGYRTSLIRPSRSQACSRIDHGRAKASAVTLLRAVARAAPALGRTGATRPSAWFARRRPGRCRGIAVTAWPRSRRPPAPSRPSAPRIRCVHRLHLRRATRKGPAVAARSR